MKLPFYSVAVIAICLLVACKSSADKAYKTEDVTLSKVENKTTTEIQQNAPPAANQGEKLANLSGENNMVSTDTTADVIGPPSSTVLQAGGPNNDDWDKKIIKTARVTLELKDYKTFNTAIHDKLKRYGAYIAGEQQTESDTRIENILTIKVPVALFEDLMNGIGGVGIKVLEKTISTEDVTGEVVDT